RGTASPSRTSLGSFIPTRHASSCATPREGSRCRPRTSLRSLARRSGEVAPRQGEALAGARLYEDGRGARADRTGDRAPAAAGADEIGPGSCMSPLVVKAAITAGEGLTPAKPLSNRQVPHR